MKIKEYYETYTEEDLENGDTDDRGLHDETDFESVGEIADYLIKKGYLEPSSSRFHSNIWYSSQDSETDMHSGDVTNYSAHLYDLTIEQQLEVHNRVKMRQKK